MARQQCSATRALASRAQRFVVLALFVAVSLLSSAGPLLHGTGDQSGSLGCTSAHHCALPDLPEEPHNPHPLLSAVHRLDHLRRNAPASQLLTVADTAMVSVATDVQWRRAPACVRLVARWQVRTRPGRGPPTT
jgi:hypothetical protein